MRRFINMYLFLMKQKLEVHITLIGNYPFNWSLKQTSIKASRTKMKITFSCFHRECGVSAASSDRRKAFPFVRWEVSYHFIFF